MIHDPLFADKILWMAERSNQQCVLCRLVRVDASFRFTPRLLIDGAIDHGKIEAWHRPFAGIASGEFRGSKVSV